MALYKATRSEFAAAATKKSASRLALTLRQTTYPIQEYPGRVSKLAQ